MPRPVPLLFVPVLLAGCNAIPDSFAPPPQRQALIAPATTGLSYFLSLTNPNADAYIVQGVGRDTEGTGYRWALEHPVFRFLVPPMDHPRFVMEFALPERTFRITGPVSLTFSLNGKLLDRARFDRPGQLSYEHEVPPDLLRFDAVNLVAIDSDRVWTSPADGNKLSFVVSRLGFVE